MILVLLSGWIMCADANPSLGTTTDMETSRAEQASLKLPSSILTEGGTGDYRRLRPKVGAWGAATIRRVIKSTKFALGGACRKVTTQGGAKRKAHCDPAPRTP